MLTIKATIKTSKIAVRILSDHAPRGRRTWEDGVGDRDGKPLRASPCIRLGAHRNHGLGGKGGAPTEEARELHAPDWAVRCRRTPEEPVALVSLAGSRRSE